MKKWNGSWANLDPLNFETDLSHGLDTKNIKDPDFPFYLLHASAEVCALSWLLF